MIECVRLREVEITCSVTATLQEAVKLLGAICLIPPDGHEKTLEAITIAAEMKGGERLVATLMYEFSMFEMTLSY